MTGWVSRLGLHRVIYRRGYSSDHGSWPESLVWDPPGKRLAVLLEGGHSSRSNLWIWPSGKQIDLPRLGALPYLRWSGDGRQIAAGDDRSVAVVDISTGKTVKRETSAVDAVWKDGTWKFLKGVWPDFDTVVGSPPSAGTMPVGTLLPTSIDRGAGAVAFRVSKGKFVCEYLPHRSNGARWIAFDPPWFEVEQRPFCFSAAGLNLIAMPERSVEGFLLYRYEKNAVRPFSFKGWRRLGRTSKVTLDEVLLKTVPARLHGHHIAFGVLLSQLDVKYNVYGVRFDFTTHSMRDIPVDVGFAAAGNGTVALIEQRQSPSKQEATLIVAK